MDIKDFPIIQMGDIIEVNNNIEMRFVCNDECEQFDGIVHPDEDWEFEEENITRVWRQIDEDYICIYKRRFYRGKRT